MTATPIPRTLALTLYGDLDLTVLDELPPGRKPVRTELITLDKQENMYNEIKERLERGEQAYVICPRISEPDPAKEKALIAKNVDEEMKRLKEKELRGFSIGKLHGKMSAREKEDIMTRFAENKIQVLVATSVIEVGINVPNATAIIIEGAERFGLSQLHQLRGRVARSEKEAVCFLVSATSSEKSVERLRTLTKARTGFELAEKDLISRGPGELSGVRQSGLTDLGMEALKNLKMVEVARETARGLIEADKELAHYPLLQEKVDEIASHFHYE
jgi:ATP-dependent DNA helicase RecG